MLEREVASGWTLAWGPTCIQPEPPVRISVEPSGTGYVEFSEPTASGRYRAAVSYRIEGEATDRTLRTEPVSW
jgi:hypothetical protein